MSRFKLSNRIFELGLNAQELSVYAYLCSLPSGHPMLEGEAIKVKQSTIARNCGIKAVQTVSKIISRLRSKELVEPLKRSVKQNRHKGTYIYNVKKLPVKDSFFFVDRHVFGELVPRQMMVYLFLCKCFSNTLNDSWNSYNDISKKLHIKRETVIETISELEAMKFIVKTRRKSKLNRRVYVDNHYQIVFFIRGTIKKKVKKVRLYLHQYNRTASLSKDKHKTYYKNSILNRKCQVLFSNRGSP